MITDVKIEIWAYNHATSEFGPSKFLISLKSVRSRFVPESVRSDSISNFIGPISWTGPRLSIAGQGLRPSICDTNLHLDFIRISTVIGGKYWRKFRRHLETTRNHELQMPLPPPPTLIETQFLCSCLIKSWRPLSGLQNAEVEHWD